jgi:hypothetical protein
VVPLLGKEARFKARLSAKDSGGQQRGVPPPPLLFYLVLTRSSMHCFAARSLVHKVLGVVLLMWYIRYVTETRSTSAWLADMLFVFFFERKKRCLDNRKKVNTAPLWSTMWVGALFFINKWGQMHCSAV